MARKGTSLIKHILLTTGLGAALVIAAGASTEAHAQSCDRGAVQPTYANTGYTVTPVYNRGYSDAHYDRHLYQRERRRDARQRRRMIRRMFRDLDYNRDGWISRYEARGDHRLWHRFRAVDRNRDGFLGRRELDRYLRRQQRRGLI